MLPGAVGYWVGDYDVLETETATIVEVSFLPGAQSDCGHDVHVELCRHLFATTQFTVGGTWTHIEVSEFDAAHTHHEHYACAKVA